MAKISTYPITSTPTTNDLLIGTDVENQNITKNFTVASIGTAIGSLFVPYIGATGNVDLGLYGVIGSEFVVNGGLSSQFLKADGSLDSTSYVPQSRTLTINGTSYDLSADRSWTISGLSSLTTTGTGGAATYLSNVLNIPIYQSQGNYITDLSGEATASGPGNASVVLSNSAVIGKILTGLVVSGGTIVSTDTILQAFGKIQNQINGVSSGLDYQGTWNAATNSPLLQSSIGVSGEYYVVDTAGSTNLNGISDWQIGDWVIFNGSTWQKIDNSDSVSSVFGRTGAVTAQSGDYTTTLVTEGTNLYFTNTRARSAVSLTTTGSSGAATYNSGTGVFNIPNYTLTGLGGVPTTRTLTINGSAYDLSLNRSWSVGTVTSVGLTVPSAFTVSNSPITNSGTIAIVAAGTSTQYIRGDGALADFPTGGGGGGSSVSYYLNGSVNQGTFAGNVYYEMDKTAIIGAGTDFSIGADGYIAQFITDSNVPQSTLIPGGNWNLEFYFSASSSGGTPSFYVELYKYDGTNFTLIASNSAVPELIAFGTIISSYFNTLAVPETILTVNDRLAIRIYVNASGRTITLHTEDNHLCQIITTFTTGLTSLNGLTKQVQYFATGTSGVDFNISSTIDTHTFNLPTASGTNRGALSTGDWTKFNSAYNNTIVSAAVTGTTTKTLTLNQQDSGTVTASWTEGGGGGSSIFIAGTGTCSSIRDGVSNVASGSCSAALSGSLNSACGVGSIVGGGISNTAVTKYSTVLGGTLNTAGAPPTLLPVNTTYTYGARFQLYGGGHVGGYSGSYSCSRVSYISANNQTWCFYGDRTGYFYGPAWIDCVTIVQWSGYVYYLAPNPNQYCVTAVYYDSNTFQTCVSLSPTFNSSGIPVINSYHSVVVSGKCNQALGKYSSIVGGLCNTASGYCSTIGGGLSNTVAGNCSTVGGGISNVASCCMSTIGGGNFNTASGIGATIGGGNFNIAYVGSAVVGGDRNAASGNFSFVGGGSGNIASGSSATISGGFCSTASGSRATISGGRANTASGNYTTIGGGVNNTVSVAYATISGGSGNTASGLCATISGGRSNTASGGCSTISGGFCSTASGSYSSILGGGRAVASRIGQRSFAAGMFAANGDAQQVDFVARNKTTNGTPVTLFLNGSNASLTITSGTAMFLTVNVSGIRSDGGAAAHYIRKVAIKNVGGTTALIGTVSTIGTDVEDNAAYDVTITANDTNDSLQINVTGAPSQTLRWVSHIQGIEIAYGT